jgi:hypothetical protein
MQIGASYCIGFEEKPMTANPLEPVDKEGGAAADPCSATTDVNAPAGSRNSLGAKSDCNGRPTSDDSVVEAKDEMGPGLTPPSSESRDSRR